MTCENARSLTGLVPTAALTLRAWGLSTTFARLSLVGIFLLLTSVARSDADVIFSNFGPGSGIDTAVAFAVFQNPVTGGRQDLALRFTVAAQNYAFTSAELALGFFGGTNIVDIVLFTNETTNVPGTSVQTVTLTGIPSSYTIVSVNAVAPVTLAANTSYWLGAIAHDGTNEAWARTSAIGDVGFGAVRDESLVWKTQTFGQREAFRINGTPLSVPEPSSLFLLVLSTVGLAGMAAGRKHSQN